MGNYSALKAACVRSDEFSPSVCVIYYLGAENRLKTQIYCSLVLRSFGVALLGSAFGRQAVGFVAHVVEPRHLLPLRAAHAVFLVVAAVGPGSSFAAAGFESVNLLASFVKELQQPGGNGHGIDRPVKAAVASGLYLLQVVHHLGHVEVPVLRQYQVAQLVNLHFGEFVLHAGELAQVVELNAQPHFGHVAPIGCAHHAQCRSRAAKGAFGVGYAGRLQRGAEGGQKVCGRAVALFTGQGCRRRRLFRQRAGQGSWQSGGRARRAHRRAHECANLPGAVCC